MSGIVKVGLFAAAAAGVYWAYRSAQKAFADFAYKIVGYGIPTINGNRLTLPVKVRFNNPAPLTIQVDNVLIDVYLLKTEGFVHVGQVSTPITLPPGVSTTDALPVINLQSIFGGFFQTVQNAIKSKSVTLRTDLTVTYKGYILPVQSNTETIDLW